MPHHRLTMHGTLGALHLEADLLLSAPWTILFGPSGSGKSTLLRAACGFLPQSDAVFSRKATDETWTPITSPPHSRALGYAAQDAAIFPHMNVLENISFATQSRRNHNHAQLVAEVIDLFDLRGMTQRLPRELSGGERQRVSLARAFAVPDMRLLLLDEPFSGVHRALRDTLLPRMQQWLAHHNIPVLSVTHDVDEALLVDAEVVRLENGKTFLPGPAMTVLAEERTRMLHALRS